MIGLYTRNKIKKVFEDIKEKIEPYNSDWLQEIAKKTIKHFNNYSYNSLISSLAMDENVIKIRERK
jgi:hypothetical protein